MLVLADNPNCGEGSECDLLMMQKFDKDQVIEFKNILKTVS